jgi:hypothetical protein
MLTRLDRTLAISLLALATGGLNPFATPATAAQVDCPAGAIVVIDDEQICFPYVNGPITQQSEPLEFDVPNSGGVQIWCIRHTHRELSSITNPWRVPCKAGKWWFHIGWDCYLRADDQATEREASWPRKDVGADEEGRVFEIRCYPPQDTEEGVPFMNGFGLWQRSQMVIGPADPPGYGGTPSVIPTLWAEAVNALAMRGPEIRTAPPVSGAALVNLPVWLWTEVGDRVWPPAPLHEFAAAAGQRVDAHGEPLRIEWDMGDGQPPVTCAGPGLAWQSGSNLLDPGPCHHVYRRASRHQPDGRYQITAITTWRVWWEINGAFDGELEIQVGSTTPYQVSEIQVLTGGGR